MDQNALFQLSYGLYILLARDGEKLNGCIVNTVIQQTDEPKQISVTVNKQNYTTEMISKTGKFNVSIMDESAEFGMFQQFGFQSGREVDKFAEMTDYQIAENKLPYLTKGCNAYLSAEVVKTIDLGTHIMFLAQVTDGVVLSQKASMTYAYYHANVKPKPQPKKTEGMGRQWICIICGYIYDEEKEGVPFEELPADWVCPLCKHGKGDFELLEEK